MGLLGELIEPELLAPIVILLDLREEVAFPIGSLAGVCVKIEVVGVSLRHVGTTNSTQLGLLREPPHLMRFILEVSKPGQWLRFSSTKHALVHAFPDGCHLWRCVWPIVCIEGEDAQVLPEPVAPVAVGSVKDLRAHSHVRSGGQGASLERAALIPCKASNAFGTA